MKLLKNMLALLSGRLFGFRTRWAAPIALLICAVARTASAAGEGAWHPTHPHNEIESFDLQDIIKISDRVRAIHSAFKSGDFELGQRLLVDYYLPPPVGEDPKSDDFVHFGFVGKFVTLYVPTQHAVQILAEVEKKCAKYQKPNFSEYVQLWTVESYMLGGDYTNGVETLRSFTMNGSRSARIEEGVLGVSTMLLEDKRPDLALAVCTNAFGDLMHPRFLFILTNSTAYSHLAAVKHAVGDHSSALDIMLSFQTSQPAAFAARYADNGREIISSANLAGRPSTAASFVAKTVQALKSGTLKMAEKDREWFMEVAGRMQRSGWLDEHFGVVDLATKRKEPGLK